VRYLPVLLFVVAFTVPSAAQSGRQVKLEWSGAGTKETESFDATGEWRVEWQATPGKPAIGGALNVTVHDAATGRPVSVISSGRINTRTSDRSYVRTKRGRYYLAISSAMATWRVAVQQ
jgi:hypothetical protein